MSAILVLILRIILALALYGFLGWAIYTIWKELRTSSQILMSRQVPPITLSILGEKSSQERCFSVSEINIGRDPSCDFIITSEMVSAHHARLSYHHNQWWVEDLHSTNGTFLNDEHLSTPTVIINNDEIRCGDTVVQVFFQDLQAS
jgi:pSer/pThr/pTyr-binding forkhead associated (FHA) protein